MKVSTDGVLLGAWSRVPAAGVVYDVGCGTGLLALMLAQRSPAIIYGVEIDGVAYEEAMMNARESQWAGRITILNGDIYDEAIELPMANMIISNPPYFTNSLKVGDKARNMARHDDSLTYSGLIEMASRKLTDSGWLSVIAPMDRRDEIVACGVERGLILNRECRVSYVEGKEAKRVMLEFGRMADRYELSTISVHESDGNYSESYRCLTHDYYLDF
ncbi:MAG: methyltransferase [Paramuribaculum sp.]|nr:methyltransferase [Paramuribaculum sp.]